MLKATKQFLLVLALVATLCLVAILVAGISQLAGAASAYDARLGPIVAWSLAVAFLLLLLWPLVIFLRFPKPLVPPDDPALQPAYESELKARLAKNPHLAGLPLETDEELCAALETLGRRADEVTEEAATRVFLGTALLQNGRLDALVVRRGERVPHAQRRRRRAPVQRIDDDPREEPHSPQRDRVGREAPEENRDEERRGSGPRRHRHAARTLKGGVSKATDALSRLKDRLAPDSDPSSA